MKKIFFFSLLISGQAVFAQQTEIYAGLNAGMLGFRGPSAVRTSFIIQSDVTSLPSYTNDQFGETAKGAAGLLFSFQRVSKSGFIWGAAAGGEVLKNKVRIVSISSRSGTVTAEGSSTFTSKYLNIAPFAGYRFHAGKKIKIDLSGSVELAFGMGRNNERGFAQPTGSMNFVKTDLGRDELGLDCRVGAQTRISCKRLSFFTGYWIGLSNFYRDYLGANNEAYSRLFRVGIGYRLK